MSNEFSAAIALPLLERHDHDTLRRDEGEGSVRQPAVHRQFREAHRHRVLELIVHHGPPDLPVLPLDRQDQARQRRERLLRGEVEDPVPLGVLGLGWVQEAHLELGAQPTEPGEEAPGRPGQGLRRLGHVRLVQRRCVDPELLAVGDDLLGGGLRELPAELASLLQVDRPPSRNRLVEALVERGLGEVGAEVDHTTVGRFDVTNDLVQWLGRDRPAPGAHGQRQHGDRLDHGLDEVGAVLDGVRDEWIAADEGDWLDQHRFYPGAIQRIQRLTGGPTRVVIVTTKEGRFARKLLVRQGLDLGVEDVYGKEAGRPKPVILRELVEPRSPARSLWFVEDRLKTLEAVKGTPGLDDVGLFLAGWGYNTPRDREAARGDSRVVLLSLERFAGDFPAWVKAS